MAATLLKYGISQRVLWNTGSIVVRQYIWDLSSSNAAAEPPSVAEKTWDSERVWRAGGHTQVGVDYRWFCVSQGCRLCVQRGILKQSSFLHSRWAHVLLGGQSDPIGLVTLECSVDTAADDARN